MYICHTDIHYAYTEYIYYTDIKVKTMTDKYTYVDIEITVSPV